MYLLSWFAIPTSMICAMTIGTIRSNTTSHDQVKYNLQKFKKWRQDAFFFVVF